MVAASGLELATLVIAVVGCVTAVGALVWQVATWRLEGPRLKVIHHFALPYRSSRMGPVWTVTAANVGRTPVELQWWRFELPGGARMLTNAFAPDWPRLPYTLNGGHQVTLYFDVDAVNEAAERHGGPGTLVTPFVTVSGRKPVKGKAFFPVAPSE